MKIDLLSEDKVFYHKEHREWLSQLNFYQDEIKFFQNELVMVLKERMESMSIIEHVDEYRKLFMKKLEHIDDIRHQIIKHEKQLAAGRATSSEEHNEVRQQFNDFVRNFEAMKSNFKMFASRND